MELRDLYGLPLERFTEERNELAKELRREGRREEAAKVSKLRKPSAAAWAVNQLVRTQRREVEALFEAGDALQKAQANLLAKRGDPGELRQVLDAERMAVDGLTEKARGLLSSDGHELPPARLAEVSETLHAAALDDGARAEVRDGCLVRELRHIGLGAVAPAKSRPPRKSKDGQPDQLRAARKAKLEAGRRAARATRDLRAAQERKDRAAAVLEDAVNELQAARERAEAAARELEEAEQAVRDAQR